VLIYAHDVDAGEKCTTAREVLRTLWADRTGVLSVQVLQEFYVNVTRKITVPLTNTEARSVVSTYSVWCSETSATEILHAFRIEDESRIRFWDALIIASAAKAGAMRLLSEDMNDRQVIAGVRIENPFKAK